MPKTEINKEDWIVRMVAFTTSADEIAIQYPGKEHNPIGRRQAAKVLFQHACDNCMIFTQEFEPGVVGIYVYEKEKNT
jgi:hypothetical protein